jgi:HEAT repeat protein
MSWALLVAIALCLPTIEPVSAADEGSDLDRAFTELATFDWGQSSEDLKPLDIAIKQARGDIEASRHLEARLLKILRGQTSRAARDYVCRKLAIVGSDESVPVLAGLLPDPQVSHMSRLALEAIASPAAVQSLRESLYQMEGIQKVGVIHSLGTLRDTKSIPVLARLLKASDVQVAGAAAAALGKIGTSDAAKTLEQFSSKTPEEIRQAVADARLLAADRLGN